MVYGNTIAGQKGQMRIILRQSDEWPSFWNQVANYVRSVKQADPKERASCMNLFAVCSADADQTMAVMAVSKTAPCTPRARLCNGLSDRDGEMSQTSRR